MRSFWTFQIWFLFSKYGRLVGCSWQFTYFQNIWDLSKNTKNILNLCLCSRNTFGWSAVLPSNVPLRLLIFDLTKFVMFNWLKNLPFSYFPVSNEDTEQSLQQMLPTIIIGKPKLKIHYFPCDNTIPACLSVLCTISKKKVFSL